MVDNQRQQAEERALKMKSVLVKTKKELTEAKKQVRRSSEPPLHNKIVFTSPALPRPPPQALPPWPIVFFIYTDSGTI